MDHARRTPARLTAGGLALVLAACAGPPDGGRALGVPDRGRLVAIGSAESVSRRLPPLPSAPAATSVEMFASTIAGIDSGLAERMSASWRPGCPVPLEDLRYVSVTYLDFDGLVRTGELVVHADVAEGIVEVFAALFEARYPLRQVRLVDDFGADDTASMDADNTSAFNCRAITGGTSWSEHAYGRAIDVNPVENPYVVDGRVAPRTGQAYAGRPEAPGVIHADDVVVRAFADAGWRWGGYWTRPIDYQHFSVSGR